MSLTDDDAIVAEIFEASKRRKAKVQCSDCGEEALYTWRRLQNAICPHCDKPLDVNSLSYQKAQAALHFRIVNLRLAGKGRN